MSDETPETQETPSTESTVDAPPTPSTADEQSSDERGRRKIREGLIVSDVMDKTVVVEIAERFQHARYGKTLSKTRKLKVHDGENDTKVGDRVRIIETRPLSKTKRWRVAEVLERAR